MVVPAGHHHPPRRPFEVPLWHLEGVAMGRFRARGPKPHAAWPGRAGKIAPFGAIFLRPAAKTGLKARFGSGRRFSGRQNGPWGPFWPRRAASGPPGRPAGPAWSPVAASARGLPGPRAASLHGPAPGPARASARPPNRASGPIWPRLRPPNRASGPDLASAQASKSGLGARFGLGSGLQNGPQGPFWPRRGPAAGLPGRPAGPAWEPS